MKILVDTNIVLDHLLERKPFCDSASWIFSDIERGGLNGYLCATTVTTIHYLVTKVLGQKRGNQAINSLLQLFEVAPVNRAVLASAVLLNFKDFEDAVLHEAAMHFGLDAIVTRNIKDFKKSKLSIYSSEELVKNFS